MGSTDPESRPGPAFRLAIFGREPPRVHGRDRVRKRRDGTDGRRRRLRGHMQMTLATSLLLAAATVAASPGDDDARTVAALDTRYQAAVKRNDADEMARILHERFV